MQLKYSPNMFRFLFMDKYNQTNILRRGEEEEEERSNNNKNF